MQSVKCIVVGDKSVGKTCLLKRYAKNDFSHQCIPHIYDSYCIQTNMKGLDLNLLLFDATGQIGEEVLQPKIYPNIDVILICFSVIDKSSFNNIKEHVRDIKKTYKNTRYFLIANKIDCRNDPDEREKLGTQRPIAFHEGESLAKKLRAYAYMECSAKTGDGIHDLFDKVILATMEPKSSCTII